MLRGKFIWIFLGLGLFCGAARAETFTVSGARIGLAIPKDWQAVTDFYGLPLAVLGPETAGKAERPVLMLVPLNSTRTRVSAADLSRDSDYQAGRRAWIRKLGGAVLGFESHAVNRWPAVAEVHSLGVRYSAGGRDVTERSYYPVCGDGKIFQLKAVVNSSLASRYEETLQGILRSFQCE